MSGAVYYDKLNFIMISLKAEIRDKKEKPDVLRRQGFLPAVLYGEGIKNLNLKVSQKQFEKVFYEAGESSQIVLEVGGKTYEVLIHQTANDPVSSRFLHVDFYHPSAQKKVEVEVPLVFEGVSLAERDLGGVLVKEIQVLEIKGLVKDLPKEIVVDLSQLDALGSRIYVKDLKLSTNISVVKKQPGEIVAHILEPKEEKEEEMPATATVRAEGEAKKDEVAEKKAPG